VVVSGIGIEATTQIAIDDVIAKPSKVDPGAGTLTVILPADKTRSAGALAIRLVNPSPGGGKSDPRTIQIM